MALALYVGLAPGAAAHQAPGPSAVRAALERPRLDSVHLARAYARAKRLPNLNSLLVSQDGRLVAEGYYHGYSASRRVNVKSVSKSILSALVGIALHKGHLKSVHQTLPEFFPEHFRAATDPRKRRITIEDLLTMRSGLQTTSFERYGAWATSRNWVRHVITRPIEADPGETMSYSTGNTHLLSAILTRATGMSTLRFANRYLAAPLGITLRPWQQDPQGIYFGGNDMYLTPREMLKFGTLYLNRGRAAGRQVVPRAWIERSLTPRTRSGWSGNQYGYGWWIRTAGTHTVYYAWGYGGQFIFLVPDLKLVVVTTSASAPRTRRLSGRYRDSRHLESIYELLERYIIPAAERVSRASTASREVTALPHHPPRPTTLGRSLR